MVANDGQVRAGAERRALQWVLRDDDERPLSAERCREAASALDTRNPLLAPAGSGAGIVVSVTGVSDWPSLV